LLCARHEHSWLLPADGCPLPTSCLLLPTGHWLLVLVLVLAAGGWCSLRAASG